MIENLNKINTEKYPLSFIARTLGRIVQWSMQVVAML